MKESGLVPNPVARLLLELAARRADGTLEVGGRTVVLHRGAVADVRPAPEDESIFAFLVNAGRLRSAQAEQLEQRLATGRSTEAALLAEALGSSESLRETRRSLALDRLVRGLAAAGGRSARFQASATEPGEAIPLVPFVLDALARRAGEEDAGLVGERANELLVLASGREHDVVKSWIRLELPDGEVPVYRLLSQSPAAAARVAALLRAGLGELAPRAAAAPSARGGVSTDVSSPSPERASRSSHEIEPRAGRADHGADAAEPAGPVAPASAQREDGTALEAPGSAARAEAATLDAPAPGTFSGGAIPRGGVRPIELPAYEAPLNDPLDDLERLIAELEAESAPGPGRSRAWAELGALWKDLYGSVGEAARAFRESASAEPGNVESLRQSARFCAAMGQLDVAEAYASAAVDSSEGPAKGECLVEYASFLERVGRRTDAVEALRAAARSTPEDPDIWAHLARALRAEGDREGAIDAGLNAATLWMNARPSAALSECEQMLQLAPAAPAVISAYARCFAASGRASAAVAWLASRARALPDDSERSQLLLEAATLADSIARPDLGADLLVEAFELGSFAEALYGKLATEVERGLPPEDAAVTLEVLASTSSPLRGEWLHRAARAHAALPGGEEWAIFLEARALSADPEHEDALAALRAFGDRAGDGSLVADALERAIRAGNGPTKHLLNELVSLSRTRLGSPQRALWALHRLAAMEPSPETDASLRELETRVHMEDRLLLLAEQDLAAAPEGAYSAAARRVAALLRDRPEERGRAIDLYWEAYRSDPGDDEIAASLERLLHVMADDDGLAALYAERFEAAPETAEGLRAGSYAAGLLQLREGAAAGGQAAARLFAAASDDRLAAARLEHAARALGDADALAAALEARSDLASTDGERARLFAKLARAHLARGDGQAAIEVALAAVELDDSLCDAHLLLMGELEALPEELALSEIDLALDCLGGTSALLERAEDLARAAGDGPRALRCLAARARLLEDSPEGAQLRVELALESGEPSELIAAGNQALEHGAIDEKTQALVERLVERLAEREPAAGSSLAVRALDRLGDPRLLGRAIEAAERSGDREVRAAALERKVAWTSSGECAQALRDLAGLFRENREPAREARAWLRLLAIEPNDEEALERLTDIYARAGERGRLAAVLSLRIEREESAEGKTHGLLLLAAAHLRDPADYEAAERVVRQALAEASGKAPSHDEVAAFARTWGHPALAERLLAPEAGGALEPAPGSGAAAEVGVVAEVRAIANAGVAAEVGAAAEVGSAATAGPQAEFEARVRERIDAGADPAELRELARSGLERFPRSGELLLTFEEAAIATGALASANATFERLAEVAIGNHARRALYARRADCLERIGSPEQALEAYLAAFALGPAEGAVFRAIERLASELGRFDVVVEAYLALVERAQHVDRRLALLRQTADVYERSLGDEGRAFDVISQAFESTGRSDLVADLRRIGRVLLERDPARGRAEYERLLEALSARVEASWNTDDRIRSLGTVAAIQWEDLGDAAAAITAADRAIELARSEPDRDATEAADIAWQLAEWLLAAGEIDEARERARAALELSPGHAQAESLLASMEEPEDSGFDDEDEDGAELEAPRLEELRDSAELLLAVLRVEPDRAEAWAALSRTSSGSAESCATAIARTIVSLFDPSVPAPGDPFRGDGKALGPHRRELLADAALERIAPALEGLWRGAMPLFRRALGYYGVVETQRFSPDMQRPLAEAYRASVAALGVENVPVYMRRSAELDLLVAPTQPISLVASDGIESAPERLAFRMGRALSLATSAHVLVATLDFDDLRVLLEALHAAFGPSERAQVSHPASSLAADLWHTVPASEQARLRDAMSVAAPALDAFSVRDLVFAHAARSGLLVSERLRVSIETLFLDDPTLRRHTYETPEAFERAVRASAPLSAFLSAAVSEEYIAARAALETLA